MPSSYLQSQSSSSSPSPSPGPRRPRRSPTRTQSCRRPRCGLRVGPRSLHRQHQDHRPRRASRGSKVAQPAQISSWFFSLDGKILLFVTRLAPAGMMSTAAVAETAELLPSRRTRTPQPHMQEASTAEAGLTCGMRPRVVWILVAGCALVGAGGVTIAVTAASPAAQQGATGSVAGRPLVRGQGSSALPLSSTQRHAPTHN